MSRVGGVLRVLLLLGAVMLIVGCGARPPATSVVPATTTTVETTTTTEQLEVDLQAFAVMECDPVGGVVEVAPVIQGWGGRDINYTISLYEGGELISTDEYRYRPGDRHRIRVGSCDYELEAEIVSITP